MCFIARPEFLLWLKSRTIAGWTRTTATETWFNHDPLPIHRSHRWIGATRRASIRETITIWAVQFVFFYAAGECVAYQLDFDEENPLGGVAMTFAHLLRVIKRWRFGGSTKATAVRRGLEKRGIEFPAEEN
jgi:hypothetical protein